jgi:hypothetical protein
VWNKHWPTSYSSLISSLSTTHSFPFPLLSLSTPYYLPSSFIDPPPPSFRPLTPCPTFYAFPSSSSKWKVHEISVSCAGNMTPLCPSFAQDLAENLQLLGRAREMSEVSGAQSPSFVLRMAYGRYVSVHLGRIFSLQIIRPQRRTTLTPKQPSSSRTFPLNLDPPHADFPSRHRLLSVPD